MEPFFYYLGANLLMQSTFQFLGEGRQRRQLEAQQRLEELRQEGNLALQQGNHAHAEKMFERARRKEREFLQLQFENQVALAKLSLEMPRELNNFPLGLSPSQVLESPEALLIITSHSVIRGIDGAPTEDYAERVRELDLILGSFLEKGYSSNSPTHSTLFFEGAWNNPKLSGHTAVTAVRKFLKSRSSLFIEYQATNKQVIVRIAHWGPQSDSFSHFTFSTFPYTAADGELVKRRLAALQALAAGAVADIHYMARDLTLPQLPSRLKEILTSNNGDDVISEAVKNVLATYGETVKTLGKLTPYRAAELALQIAEDLSQLSDKTYAEHFIATSLQMFTQHRGGKPLLEERLPIEPIKPLLTASDRGYLAQLQQSLLAIGEKDGAAKVNGLINEIFSGETQIADVADENEGEDGDPFAFKTATRLNRSNQVPSKGFPRVD